LIGTQFEKICRIFISLRVLPEFKEFF
jgi:hypothetical protein